MLPVCKFSQPSFAAHKYVSILSLNSLHAVCEFSQPSSTAYMYVSFLKLYLPQTCMRFFFFRLRCQHACTRVFSAFIYYMHVCEFSQSSLPYISQPFSAYLYVNFLTLSYIYYKLYTLFSLSVGTPDLLTIS